MRMSTGFIATLRDSPRDAETVSHQLMSRSGMLRKHGAGLYSYLPLLTKSYHKLSRIIREELDAIGWQEVIMPFVVPAELWKESGRWDTFGDQMLRLQDRKGNSFCLGPTHEEVVTDLVRSQVTSYKQLPVVLYQITPKFRDELRPRFGLMRGREFIMMDGYSFHLDTKDLDHHYEVVAKAYENIFKRAGLQFRRVEADTGAIGGSGSHEYHVLAQSGEDALLSCSKCSYAANVEKAETPSASRSGLDWGKPTAEKLQEVATPGSKSIEAVSRVLSVPHHRNIKTLVYRFNTADNPKQWNVVAAFVGGHRELNEVKLKTALTKKGFAVLDLAVASEGDIQKTFACVAGSLGPVGLGDSVVQVFDRELSAIHDGVCGANKDGFHLVHVEPSRDIPQLAKLGSCDIVNAVVGDACPRCEGGVFEGHRGIEVGHIFKLGDKYSAALGAKFQAADKSTKTIEMGTYGIGVTRTIAACVEQNFDADGIVWPESLAPFDVHVVQMGQGDSDVDALVKDIEAACRARGWDVLIDDRDLSAGVKFKDADLIGVPRRVTVGKKDLEQSRLQISHRKVKTKVDVPFALNDRENSIGRLVQALERL